LTKGKQAAKDAIKRKRVKARKKGRVPRASQDKRRKVDQEMEVWVNQGWIPLGDRAVPLNEEPRVTKVSFEEDLIQINDRSNVHALDLAKDETGSAGLGRSQPSSE
jgi:hypothetical protein